MSRIRSIHPGLWTDSAFINISMPAGLFFIGLWNFADDNGIFEWHPQALKLRIMPGRRVNIKKLLMELLDQHLIEHYVIRNSEYGKIRNFRKWQKPQKPFYKYPDKDGIIPSVSSSSKGYVFPVEQEKTNDAETIKQDCPEKISNKNTLKKISPIEEEKERKKVWKEEEKYNLVYQKELHELNIFLSQNEELQGLPLANQWCPNKEGQIYAESLGLNIKETVENFRDYWLAKAGKDALKRDWNAAWRSWCRKSCEWQKRIVDTAKQPYSPQSIKTKNHPLDWMVHDHHSKWNKN